MVTEQYSGYSGTRVRSYSSEVYFTMSRYLSRALCSVQDLATRAMFGTESVTNKLAFYSLIDHDMNGNEVKMSDFRDSVLLIVNVASK